MVAGSEHVTVNVFPFIFFFTATTEVKLEHKQKPGYSLHTMLSQQPVLKGS